MSAYDIEFAIEESTFGATRTGLAVAKRTLAALGLTRNVTGPAKRVRIHSGEGGWTVNIPTDRAEEYARQAWKDSATTDVTINGISFPKPTTLTVEEADSQLNAFKAEVYKKAMEKAEKHGWCDVVQDTLRELGIEAPKAKVRITLELEYDEGTRVPDFQTVYDLPRPDLQRAIKSVEKIDG